MAVILERKKAISETIWNAEIQERINKIEEYVVEHHDYINSLQEDNTKTFDRLRRDVNTAQLEIKHLSSELQWSTENDITLKLPIVEK